MPLPTVQPAAVRRNLIAVSAACFIGFAGFTLVMPFLPLYFAELGVRDVGEIAFWSGISLGVTPAITALLSPLWGRVSDRFGRKLMVERSLVCFIVTMVALAYVTEPWHVFAIRALQGLFAGYGALALAMAAESAPPGRMASAIGTVQTAQRLGPALGPAMGGLLAQLVGLRRAFLVSSLFYVLALVLVFVLYREERRAASSGPSVPDERVTFTSVLAFEHFLLLMGVIFAMQFVDRSLGPILPLHLAALGVPADRIPIISGLLFSAMAVTAAVGHHACGPLLRRRSAHLVIAGGAIVSTVVMLLFIGLSHGASLIVVAAVFGFAVGIAMTASYATAGAVIPDSARATGFGFLSSASLSALALSPMVSGALAARSLSLVFVVNALLTTIVAGVVWRLMTPDGLRGRSTAPPSEAPVVDEE